MPSNSLSICSTARAVPTRRRAWKPLFLRLASLERQLKPLDSPSNQLVDHEASLIALPSPSLILANCQGKPVAKSWRRDLVVGTQRYGRNVGPNSPAIHNPTVDVRYPFSALPAFVFVSVAAALNLKAPILLPSRDGSFRSQQI